VFSRSRFFYSQHNTTHTHTHTHTDAFRHIDKIVGVSIVRYRRINYAFFGTWFLISNAKLVFSDHCTTSAYTCGWQERTSFQCFISSRCVWELNAQSLRQRQPIRKFIYRLLLQRGRCRELCTHFPRQIMRSFYYCTKLFLIFPVRFTTISYRNNRYASLIRLETNFNLT